jgi:hypothetical protein
MKGLLIFRAIILLGTWIQLLHRGWDNTTWYCRSESVCLGDKLS